MMFNIYIARARDLFGVTKTREIYEKAVESLENKYIPEMCLKYSNLEVYLAQLVYCGHSSFAFLPPRITNLYVQHRFKRRTLSRVVCNRFSHSPYAFALRERSFFLLESKEESILKSLKPHLFQNQFHSGDHWRD